MKIAVLVGQYHEGSTAEYVLRALAKLGYVHSLITPRDLPCESFSSYDLYLGVDSGLPFPLRDAGVPPGRTAFWFIDYRHNKNRIERSPTDAINAKWLAEHGGWVFQAQAEDVNDCILSGITRVSWLPLAADPEVWRHHDMPKSFALGIAGNVWDHGRAKVLQMLAQQSLFKVAIGKPGKIWKENSAKLLSSCQIGFNVSSFFGSEVAFDVNMRVFETLSCGIPLVTNWVPNLFVVVPKEPQFCRTFQQAEEVIPLITALLKDEDFLSSGAAAREFIETSATYQHRLHSALDVLGKHLSP